MKKILEAISYNEEPYRVGFTLQENSFDKEARKEELSNNSVASTEDENSKDSPAGKRSRSRSPRRLKKPVQHDSGNDEGHIHSSLEQNRRAIEKIYGLPVNKDIIIRDFTLGTDTPQNAFLVFIDGMVSRTDLNYIMESLMLDARVLDDASDRNPKSIMKNILPGSQTIMLDTFEKVTESVNYGDTAFFFEGSTSAIAVETKGWEHRSIDRPNTEQTITGPQEAFIENLRANTALVRKIIRSEHLYTELIKLGTRFRSDVAVMYIKDLANPDLVTEVKRRISSIKVDYIIDTGMLLQYIEDSPYNLNPQALSTERPDTVASHLAEGKVAILLSGSPFALVVPITMYAQLHTGEETYLRWQYGTFIRYVRTISFYLALLLPGSYLAIVLYHQEMIPTELLLAIAGNRERVPFPTVVEMLLMEFSFELVREAGIRIPSIIGQTIGIVGALILGQAAVQANLVSPVVVILVAVTGLASFSIPSFALAFAVRTYRFFYIIAGVVLGFYGIAITLFVQILLTTNLKSFGVPYLSPTGPRTYAGGDIVNRMPLFLQRRRPDFLNALDDTRTSGDPRGWVKEKGGGGDTAG
ncbi:MAG: spore germination protein [Desulfocucumaceae bacterium]